MIRLKFGDVGLTSFPVRVTSAVLLTALILLSSFPVFAASNAPNDLDWVTMIVQLCGGLAIFLYGMEKMSKALKKVAGDRMRYILGKLTVHRVMGVLTGAGVTAIIQSSSVTTVMLVSFVAADLMSLTQAVGVIFGANIGTTITAQIVAFKVTKWALVPVAIGFIMEFAGKKDLTRNYGTLLMGLGLVFFGLAVMSAGMKPLRSYQPFIDLMQDVSNPLIGILISMTFTALVQSSSATTGVIIALATQGLIPLEGGIALIYGANIGTCVTAGLAAIGKPREAVRVAVAHVTFNVLGVLIAAWFIGPFADLVRSISPSESGLTGMDLLAADVPRQVANAHSIFNVAATLIFLPFAAFVARFAQFIVPDGPVLDEELGPVVKEPRYLDDELLSTPALALGRARMETGHIGESVNEMLKAIQPAIFAGNEGMLKQVAAMDSDVDNLYGHTIQYLRKLHIEGLTSEQGEQFTEIIDIATNLENIGDVIETDMVTIGLHAIEDKVVISEPTKQILSGLHKSVQKAMEMSFQAMVSSDNEAAQAVLDMNDDITKTADNATAHCAERLVADTPNRMNTYAREVELIEKYRRIYSLTKRIASSVARSSQKQQVTA